MLVVVYVSWTLIVQWSELSSADKSWSSVVIGRLQEVQIFWRWFANSPIVSRQRLFTFVLSLFALQSVQQAWHLSHKGADGRSWLGCAGHSSSWLSGQGGQAVPPASGSSSTLGTSSLYDPRRERVGSEDYGFKTYIEVRSPYFWRVEDLNFKSQLSFFRKVFDLVLSALCSDWFRS